MIQGETTFHRRPSLHRGFNPSGADIDFAVNLEAGEALRTHKDGSQQEVVINEDGADIDFRVESDGVTNMLLVDASLNGVGIGGAASSTYELMVYGNQQITNAEAGSNGTELYVLDTVDHASIQCRGTTQASIQVRSLAGESEMNWIDIGATANNAFSIRNGDGTSKVTLTARDYELAGAGFSATQETFMEFDLATGEVGIGGAAVTSAALAVTSTTSAFMPPRMTTTQRDAISSAAAGMVVYNTTTNVLNFHNGTGWKHFMTF